MSDDKVIRVLRAQAWERAKGELRSILQTYWGEQVKFDVMREEVEEFIARVEDGGFAE